MLMFFSVFSQVCVLLILVGLGVLLAKSGILNESAVKSITDFVLIIVTPSVIIKSFIRKLDMKTLRDLLISFLIAFCLHILFIVASRLLIRLKDVSRERVLRFGIIFTNCGYMSIPMQQALLGETGVFYASSFVAIFNLFVWSYGVIAISGDKKYLSPKKLIFNPGIIGLTVGMVIFLFSLPVPEILSASLSHVASLNTPLPMIILGYHLAQTNLLYGLRDLQCLWAIALRLLILPGAVLGLLYLCGVRGDMLVSAVISSSAPSAAITTMFSSKFGADTSLSVNMVSLSTVLSLFSMPLIITMAQIIA